MMQWINGFQDLIGPDSKDILWWQMSIRAVLIFLFGLILIRLFGRRAFGQQTPLDVILAIIIGSNLSRALTANAEFFPTLAATSALAVLFWLIGHGAARWGWFSSLVKGDPVWLIRQGQTDERAMRGVAISEGDIDESARESGLEGLDAVDAAALERSGRISTIAKKTA